LISIKPREGSIGHRACMLDRQNEPLGPNAEDDVATLARKVDFLSRSDSYNLGARNSHRARDPYVLGFMAGDRVYKLKKASTVSLS